MTPQDMSRLVEGHVSYDFDFLYKRCNVLAERWLQPSATAVTVRPEAGEMVATPGPVQPTDRPLTCFYLIECADLAEAVELASGYPMPDGLGSIEVRPVTQGWDYAPTIDTEAAPSTVWRCLVDVASWPEWKHGVEKAELAGAFGAGAAGQLVVSGQPPMAYRIVTTEPERGYVSETELAGGVALRVEYSLSPRPDGGTRITLSAKVPREALDVYGFDFSPRLGEGMRGTLAALAARFEPDGKGYASI
jgi:hypothetical protein